MDALVTVFGGGGFLGRYVTQALLERGARVRVVGRDPSKAYYLRPLGGLGQTQFATGDVTRAGSAAKAARGSDAVVNLVGVLSGDFRRFHVDGARFAADAARDAGARAFVQVSAIGADPANASAYGRSKGEGEAAARASYAAATVIRPSILFGAEDQFVNRFAKLARLAPVLPVVRGDVLFQPAWVADAAGAIARAALEPQRFGGRTFELGGPERISMHELNRYILQTIGRPPRLFDVPDGVAAMLARLGGRLPGAPMTWDQWLMLQRDNVVAEQAEGFAAFDIAPEPLAAIAPDYLVQYRRGGRFGLAGA